MNTQNPNNPSIEYAQKVFEESQNEVKEAKAKIHVEALWRRIVAYGLKALAVFGALAITSGISETAAHRVGIAIAIAVALDGLFVNHGRLLVVTKADTAFKHLLRDVINEHQNRLGPILDLKLTNPEQAKADLNQLNIQLKTKLDTTMKEIDLAVEEADLKALTALSLDSNRKTS